MPIQEVSEVQGGKSLLVNQKCLCPEGKRCPVRSITSRRVWQVGAYL